mgnify:CR=1 FL=1
MIATDQVLIAPIVTEKSVSTPDKVVFSVHLDASVDDVKRAVLEYYKIEVVKVNMINLPAKTRNMGRKIIRKKAPTRKAIVTLPKGATLNFNDFK